MSCQAKKPIARMVVDSREFAQGCRRLSGAVAVAEMARLVDVVADDAGLLECELIGERDEEGKLFLLLTVRGGLNLRCQRCLGTLHHVVDIDSRLLLVEAGEAWPDDELVDDTYDAVASSREFALLPLVEEEVLLALPIAPMHEECQSPLAADAEQRPSPFGVLASLKKH